MQLRQDDEGVRESFFNKMMVNGQTWVMKILNLTVSQSRGGVSF